MKKVVTDICEAVITTDSDTDGSTDTLYPLNGDLCHQYRISVAEAQTSLLAKWSEENRLFSQALLDTFFSMRLPINTEILAAVTT